MTGKAELLETLYDAAQGLADQIGEAVVRARNGEFDAPGKSAIDSEASVQIAKRYLRARRERVRLFPEDLFADPAWDILLDLYVAEATKQRISISAACIASGVPSTTGLRWIGRLEELGLVRRNDDPSDRRRAYISLTPHAVSKVERWIAHHLVPIWA